MIIKRLSSSILQNHIKSSLIYSRNVQAVSLAYNKFLKDEGENFENNLIVLHGLFGSKSNW